MQISPARKNTDSLSLVCFLSFLFQIQEVYRGDNRYISATVNSFRSVLLHGVVDFSFDNFKFLPKFYPEI